MGKTIIGFETKEKDLIGTMSLQQIIIPNLKDKRIMMGVPSETADKRKDKKKEEDEEINNAYLLAIHEHGTTDGRIPARPLIEPVLKQEERFIKKGFETYLKMIEGKNIQGADVHLEKMALYIETKLKEYFDNNTWTPNAPSTIAKKGSAKPLIDTGDLRRSIKAFVDENI